MVVVPRIRRAVGRPANAGSPTASMAGLIIDSRQSCGTSIVDGHAFRPLRQAVAARQRIYRQSDAIAVLELPAGVSAGARCADPRGPRARRPRRRAGGMPAGSIDALVAGYRVPKICVRVLAQRPADETGELQGLYEPDDARKPARITVWMRTAARSDVVAFKTFSARSIHELCHHLDYEPLQDARNLSHRGLLTSASRHSRTRPACAGECAAGGLTGLRRALE